MTYQRHPLSADNKDITGEAFDELVAGVRKFGIVGRKITLHEGKVLDGWQLYQACLAAGVTPDFEPLPPGLSPEDLDYIRNDLRRQNEQEEIRRRREKRIARIADARKSGKSTRTIADAEGISQQQVRRDLEKSVETGGVSTGSDAGVPGGGAPEPTNGKVIGTDGKTYAATKPDSPKAPPKPKILCKRCERVGGAVQGCTNCKMAREAARASANGDGKGDAHEGEPKEPKVALMDQLGNPVPKGLRDTFVGCRESLDNGVKLLQEVRRTVKGLSKWNAWMRPTDMETAIGNLIEDLKNGLPYSVCQDCSGKGCKVCRQEGWLTRWRHDELAAK